LGDDCQQPDVIVPALPAWQELNDAPLAVILTQMRGRRP
jgi:hypothetical protein